MPKNNFGEYKIINLFRVFIHLKIKKMNLSERAKIYLANKTIHRVDNRSITLDNGYAIFLNEDEIDCINSHVEDWGINQQEDEDVCVKTESGEPHTKGEEMFKDLPKTFFEIAKDVF
jgi:hypothetical protein